MKRPWEIYLDLLQLAGWGCSFTQQFDYEKGLTSVRATAFRGDASLQGTGITLGEAVANLAREFVNLNIEGLYV